jgi:uncharacterized membrane protein YkvA (DUF1232 family)
MTEPAIEIDVRARERRLYDRLRARVLRAEPGAPAGLRDLLLLVPDLMVLLGRLVRDPRVPPGSKVVALLGVGYALSPIDLLPEILLGPIGLIDDLLIVGAALSHVLNHVHPDVVRAHWSGQGDVLEIIQRITAWSESTMSRLVTWVLGFRPTSG